MFLAILFGLPSVMYGSFDQKRDRRILKTMIGVSFELEICISRDILNRYNDAGLVTDTLLVCTVFHYCNNIAIIVSQR